MLPIGPRGRPLVASSREGSVMIWVAMGRCSNSKCDLLPLLKSGLASSSLEPAQLSSVVLTPKSTDIFTGLQLPLPAAC